MIGVQRLLQVQAEMDGDCNIRDSHGMCRVLTDVDA